MGFDALVAVWGTTESEGKVTVDRLVDRGLLEPVLAGRYWVHALLVAHAKSLLSE